jgi:hypothetical protein
MVEFRSLVIAESMRVGQKVKVKTCIDRVSKEVAAKIGEVGTVQGEKIVDGGKMGYIVTFADNKGIWFFPDELELVG